MKRSKFISQLIAKKQVAYNHGQRFAILCYKTTAT